MICYFTMDQMRSGSITLLLILTLIIVAELYSFNVTPNIFLSLINTDSSYYIDTLHAVKPQLAFIFQSELYYLPALWSCIHTSLIHCPDHHLKPCHSHSHTVL